MPCSHTITLGHREPGHDGASVWQGGCRIGHSCCMAAWAGARPYGSPVWHLLSKRHTGLPGLAFAAFSNAGHMPQVEQAQSFWTPCGLF